jgi:hypothetical protein
MTTSIKEHKSYALVKSELSIKHERVVCGI